MHPGMDRIQLKTNPHLHIISHSRTVWISDRDGWMSDHHFHGLFLHDTRLLSHYLWKLNGDLYCVELSGVRQHSQLAYYIAAPRRLTEAYSGKDHARSAGGDTEENLELTLATLLSDGFHQDAEFCNYTLQPQPIALEIQYDADFADLREVIDDRRQQRGRLSAAVERGAGELRIGWHYRAHHWHGIHRRELDRGFELRFHGLWGEWRADRRRLRLSAILQPGERRHLCIESRARIERQWQAPVYGCFEFYGGAGARDRQRQSFYAHAAQPPQPRSRRNELERAYARALDDLASLHLPEFDRGPNAWVPAAGVPNYLTLFGRDSLTVAWQAALAGWGMMRGALRCVAELQGKQRNDWRDELPGRMPHETHTGPLSVLDYIPLGRYYGEFTSTPFFPVVLSEYYHWSGDRAGLQQLLPSAQGCLEWLRRYGDLDGDGLYEYQTRSRQGVANQAWKDSGDAIVWPDGRVAEPPLGTCEQQGFAYEAWLRAAELLWMSGERGQALRAFRHARDLKARFNDAFWMEDEQFYALALDRRKRQIRSIASNAGDALATGIIAGERSEPVVERLFSDELYSGWGVRTLSNRHPAFNPYSYHRGSVWPAENAAIMVGLRRYGYYEQLQRLAAGLLDITAIFEHRRLPEVFSGHARDRRHPFPAVYPRACSPQAWSASAIILSVQMLLGLYPYAPAALLFLDPALPAWLPELELYHLHVGAAEVSLRFERGEDGRTHYQVLDQRGKLRLIRQPSPWSVTTTPWERLEDLIESLAA